jgi:molybdopterin synthase sulfur carrier subunit
MPRMPAPLPADGDADAAAAVRVEFAASLRRHVDCAAQQVPAGPLRQVLEAALAAAPALAGYVFDDQRNVRKHVAVFLNEQMVRERHRLDQPVAAGDRVLVVQALTGG